MAGFSAYGTSENGAVKPDLVAPGKNIIARIVNLNMGLAASHPANKVDSQYFRMSGTSRWRLQWSPQRLPCYYKMNRV